MTIPSWVRGTLLLAATFAGGVAAGVAYERRSLAAHDAVGLDAHEAMHRLVRDLDLDPAQQQAISAIIARHQKDVDATWRAMQPHVRATLESTDAEIARILRPEQVVKFRSIHTLHPAGHR